MTDDEDEETKSQNEIMVNAMDQFVSSQCEIVEGGFVSFNRFAAAFFHHFQVIGVKCDKCSVKGCDKFYGFGKWGPNKIALDIFLILEMYIKKKGVAINTRGLREGGDLGCIFVYGIRIKDFKEGEFLKDVDICKCPFGVKRCTQGAAHMAGGHFIVSWHSKTACPLMD